MAAPPPGEGRVREVRRAGVGVAVTAVFPAPTPGPRRAASASSCPPVRSAAGPLPGAARDAGSGDQGSHGRTGPRGRHRARAREDTCSCGGRAGLCSAPTALELGVVCLNVPEARSFFSAHLWGIGHTAI